MSLFLAVISDVIDSRNSKEAPDIYERLLKVNNEAGSDLLVPFKCLRGDETEAVLDINGDFLRIVRTLKYHLQPMKIRIGIGIGSLDARDDELPKDPFLINGAAFYAAREAIDAIKQKYRQQESIALRINRGAEEDIKTLDIMLSMYGSITGRWNGAQWDAVMEYEKQGSMEAAAKVLGRKYQSVQRSLDRADWDVAAGCEKWITERVRSFVSVNSI